MNAALVGFLLFFSVADISFFEKNPPLSTCEIRGINEDGADQIRKWLSVLPEDMQEAIDLIVIHSRPDDNFKPNSVAYCEERNGRVEIHALRRELSPEVIWHEASHAFDFRYYDGNDVYWRRLIGNGFKNKSRYVPSRGVLTEYGLKGWAEDKADWIRHIYKYLSGRGNTFVKIKDREDLRYLRKLELLRDEGAISLEDYEKIARLFEAH